jgi:hypothetical protein
VIAASALWRRVRQTVVAAGAAASLLAARDVYAQAAAPPLRDARFEWDEARKILRVGVSFRDVIDGTIRKKLSRGLPTTIVLTGTIYRSGSSDPVSTTTQTCKITWHVWDEVYLLEIARPGSGQPKPRPTSTIEGVLRRCAEVNDLIVGDYRQIPLGSSVYMQAKVQVNPVSQDVLQKLKRWVSRPSGTGTAAPGDALFSTFTGLFLQRMGEAERELKFTTKTIVPLILPKK